MRVFILDKEKITKFNLPTKISGVFAVDYLPVNSKIKRTVSIEAFNGQWIIKSNGVVNVLNGNILVQSAVLEEYCYHSIQIKDRNDVIGIYCVPSIETNYERLSLTKNQLVIGSGNDVSIGYSHNLVLPKHVAIAQVEDNSWYIQAAQDDYHFAYLNGERIVKNRLKVGDVIFVYGLKIIWMGKFIQVNHPPGQLFINNFNLVSYVEDNIEDNTQITPVSEEEIAIDLYNEHDYFFHTPRLKQSLIKENIKIDPPPKSELQEELPFLLTLGSTITMLSTSMMTGYTAIYGLVSGEKMLTDVLPSLIMCGSLLIGSLLMPRLIAIYQKRRRKKREKYRQDKYTKYVKDKENEINLRLVDQAQILRNNNMSINECYSLVFAKGTANIWNREIRDDDFLTIKVGMGNCPAKLEIEAPEEHFSLDDDNLEKLVIDVVKELHTLENVPITFSFLEKNISAFICNSSFNQDFLNGVFLQLMAYHSSQDLKLVFLLTADDEHFGFAKYAPHCLSDDKTVRFFATNMEEIKKVSAYLDNEFKDRKQTYYGRSQAGTDGLAKQIDRTYSYKNFEPYYIIITNDYTAIKNISIVSDVVENVDNLGFSLTLIDESLQSLPNECSAFIELLDKESCIIEKDLNNQSRFTAEVVQGLNMRAVANRLANIPIAMDDGVSSLPNSLTFLEMYNVARIEQLNILNRWKENNPTISLQAPIGVHTSGELFELDLHEKFHGPHGLIAGSTGSGKSEFIITYLLSMAVNYHPDEVQFVLIDYKGGGLAGAFENRDTGVRIPHVVGTITNLDTSEMNRTLVSINSELKRRQRMFNEAKNETGESTIDIYKYQHYYREGVLKKPISHLFIVSDEFAELKSQQPDFMNELISTARIGRSLGVHLILATQKPSGVVNDQIWSNTRFRVCLKVQDRGDSMEVLKKPDAASLKETGRFYLQVGYDEYFDIGQSGWAGAKYLPSDAVIKKIDDSIKFINHVGNVTKVVSEAVKRVETVEKGDQLTNIVKYLVNIAKDEDYQSQKLWLDKIPAQIFVKDLKQKYNYSAKPYELNPIIGEYDNPVEQMQGLLTLNITEANTLVYGMADSGKENLATTLIYSCITEHSPDEIHLYLLDFGAETLKIFSKVPHVGDVCTVEEQEKILNLFIMIDKELDKRKELFVDYSGSYVNYCKTSGKKLPLITIVINNYEVFYETMPKIAELITSMYRDSLKYGISFVIIAGAANSFRMRLAEYFTNKLCLQMATETDYRNILMCERGLIPAKISGRGISGIPDLKYEFQTAYISNVENINSTLKETVSVLADTYTSKAPRVPVLPDVVTVEHVIESLKDLSQVPVGVDIDTKLTYTYNFTKNKINTIIYDNIEENTGFLYSLFSLLKTVPLTKVRTLDITKKFDNSKIPVECYTNNFDAVLNALIQEMESNDNKDIKRVYVINGISALKEKLDAASIPIYEKMFRLLNSIDTTILILTDSYTNYKKFQLEPWYHDVIDNKNGIWLGTGIANQLVFSIPNMSMDVRNANFPDMAFAINDGQVIPFKKIVNEKSDENEK